MAISEKHIMSRLYLIAALLLIFVSVLVMRIVDIQLIDGEAYKKVALNKTQKRTDIPPIRGNIFADDGSLLASSVPKYTLHFDPTVVRDTIWKRDIAALCDSMGAMFNRPSSYYSQKFRKARANRQQYLKLASNRDYPEYVRMRKFPIFKQGRNRGGLIVDYKVVREHPLGEMAWRSIGYERMDDQGIFARVGIDGAYGRDYLRGTVGKRLVQKTSGGVWKPVTAANIVEPSDGVDIVSTLNTNIQDIAHTELKKQLEEYNADHGCVVVMEVKTGEVKAIANLGKDKKGNFKELRNYAVWEAHEPGSTFKLMSLLAALEDGMVDTTDVYDTNKGVWKVYGKSVRDSKRGGYGKISIAEGFAVSSNTVFAQFVHDNYAEQPDRFVDRLRNFKLHEPLGLPIVGEGFPKLRYPGEKGWSGLSLAWMSHGYEVALTPLQTLTFYNAIANNGTMVKPRFVKQARVGNRIERDFDTEVIIKKIATDENLGKVKKLLQNVVEKDNGTGSDLYDPNFSMAGKTGTCWKNYWAIAGERDYISSFVGYFPADEPKYSCIVVIHEPDQEKGIYGADVAGPVFKSMAQKIYLTSPVVEEVSPNVDLGRQLESNFEKYYAEMRKEYHTIPDVRGMSGMDAVSILENLGLNVEVRGNGKVREQSIPKGAQIKDVEKIVLKLS